MLKPSRYYPRSTPLSRALVRQRYVLSSIAVHIALGVALMLFLEQRKVESTLQANQRRISTSLHAAQQANQRKKVDQLEAMKKLMEHIDKVQQEGEPQHEETDTQTPEAKDPIKEKSELTQQQTLEHAKALRDRILQMEQKARAKDLAEVLKIPESEALKQVKQEAQKTTPPEEGAPRDSAEVAQTLERYEKQAQASLERRQQQEERRVNGGKVQPGPSHDTSALGPASLPYATDGEGVVQNGRGGDPRDTSYARAADEPSNEKRQYSKPLLPVEIRLQDLRLGHGNAIGSDAPLANRVVIDRWYVIGPFTATDNSSIKTIYPPEMLVDLDGVYLGKGSRVLQWQYFSSARYPLIPPEPVAKAIYYGYTEIRSDSARDVWMALGADDDAKLWVNDKLVWVSGNALKPWYMPGGFGARADDLQTAGLIEERRLVHLKKGRNTVLFKLYNGILDVFMTVAIEQS